jgi:hypothetical protein
MPRARKYDGTVYRRAGTLIWWIRYRDRNGIARRESSQTADWREANRKLRERLQARDDNLLEVVRKGETLAFGEWADRFLENYSKPPIRAEKTHEANQRCMKHLKAAFAKSRLVDVTADSIELFLRDRLRQRIRVKAKLGYKELGAVKATTVHQEFRVLRCMLNVAVRKKLLRTNPCSAVGVSGIRERAIPTPLRYVVRTAENRIAQPAVFAECDSNHHRNGVARL